MGKSRNYEVSDEDETEQRRACYIHSRQTSSGVTVQRSDVANDGSCCHGNRDGDSTPGREWGTGFQPRERVETTRNCASLPRDFVDRVVLRVANALLRLTGGPGSRTGWNQGGRPQTQQQP